MWSVGCATHLQRDCQTVNDGLELALSDNTEIGLQNNDLTAIGPQSLAARMGFGIVLRVMEIGLDKPCVRMRSVEKPLVDMCIGQRDHHWRDVFCRFDAGNNSARDGGRSNRCARHRYRSR